jgi:hypothetical protein
MRIVKKIGYGILSLATLFFTTRSSGYPTSGVFGSIRLKLRDTVVRNGENKAQHLILQQANPSSIDSIANGVSFVSHTSHSSHSSHSSHASHASHSSGTSGAASTSARANSNSSYNNPFAQHLTVAEVQTISGIYGLQLNLEPMTLHFVQSSGKEILKVKFFDRSYFYNYKSDPRFSPVNGIGEGAIVGTLQLPMQLLFIKGKYCVEITTFPSEGLAMFLTFNQMKMAADHIVPRLLD